MVDAPDHMKPFTDMAETIGINGFDRFAGAFVIVGPNGEPISGMLIDTAKNEAAFWAMVKAKVEIAISEFEQNQHKPGQFGGRR